MNQKINSTNGGKDEETYKCSALHEEGKIDREISVKEAESLTNQELLAVILSGDMGALNAVNLLKTYEGNLIHLFCTSVNQLMEIDGIGFQEAQQQVAAQWSAQELLTLWCVER